MIIEGIGASKLRDFFKWFLTLELNEIEKRKFRVNQRIQYKLNYIPKKRKLTLLIKKNTWKPECLNYYYYCKDLDMI